MSDEHLPRQVLDENVIKGLSAGKRGVVPTCVFQTIFTVFQAEVFGAPEALKWLSGEDYVRAQSKRPGHTVSRDFSTLTRYHARYAETVQGRQSRTRAFCVGRWSKDMCAQVVLADPSNVPRCAIPRILPTSRDVQGTFRSFCQWRPESSCAVGRTAGGSPVCSSLLCKHPQQKLSPPMQSSFCEDLRILWEFGW